ncbi:bifunctional TH2 protein, mitochondrial-like [Mangifera indica]|uniref:bifunctional TH2 protein, mitochondrial-like n=1 Tax=Mangifera indica TaxID=29780 RepID=UPI001CFBC6A5|nr:bifunctional TH2 protein, mitochondrial-like [Mangifera indica]
MTMGGVDEGRLARKFWNKFKNEFVFIMYSPFFVSLASGTLKSDTFLNCVAQDVHFLKAFAHSYELAEECADDEEDKCAIRKLRKRVKHKLLTLDSLVREWGFELPEECITNNATLKYTDFLLATASGKVEGEKVLGKIETPFEKTKVAAYTIGAISPCLRLFAFITKEIQPLLDPNDSSHIYKKWVEYYCSETFEESTAQTEELLDKLSVSLTGEELDIIEKLYHQAVKLDVDFYSAQPMVQPTVVPLSWVKDPVEGQLTVFCDFDLTCTAFDSSAILAEIAIVTSQKADPDQSESKLIRMSSADLRNTWGVLSTKYTEEHEQCIDSIMPSEAVGKFDYEGLCEALKQLGEFERKINSRVVESGVLKGLNLEDIKRTGQLLMLQDGCRGFFQKIVKCGNYKTDVHVLSYCWSGDLIRSAFSSGDPNMLKVHSNELVYEESISTGDLIKNLESPLEKRQVFNDIVKDRRNNDQNLTIYIGGSLGDLLCLLEADIGIVIGSSSSLRRLGQQFGVSFVPLFSGLVEKQKELTNGGSFTWNRMSGTLYTVSSWAEIQAFVLGS